MADDPPATKKEELAEEPSEVTEEEEERLDADEDDATESDESDDDEEEAPAEGHPKAESGQPTPKKSDARKKADKETAAPEKKPAKASKEKAPPAPRRPKLDGETARLLAVRRAQDDRRPRFTRQQSYRYYSLGRWESWRRPRGLQSKQRRHYGYRSQVVSIGFGTPKRVRGLTPSGFRPVLVRTPSELEALDVQHDAAIIARTVGTRRRLSLEEIARKRGLHVLNPIVTEERGEE